jgi:acyl carrier protein
METATKIYNYLETRYSFSRKNIHFNNQTLLLEEKVIDSLGMLELISFVEENFGIEVPDEDISPDNFGTIDRLARYVDCRRNQPVV